MGQDGLKTTIATISELEKTYKRAQVIGELWESPTVRTDRPFEALALDPKDVTNIMLQVGGDLTRYEDI